MCVALAFLLSLAAAALVRADLPPCYPTGNTGSSIQIDKPRGEQVCCQLNTFKKLCSKNGASPDAVNLDMTIQYPSNESQIPPSVVMTSRNKAEKPPVFFLSNTALTEEEAAANYGKQLAVFNAQRETLELNPRMMPVVVADDPSVSIAINATTPEIIVKFPSDGKSFISGQYDLTLRDLENVDLHTRTVKMRAYLYDNDQPRKEKCSFVQIVSNLGSKVQFDIAKECLQICQKMSSGMFCTPMMFCSQAIIGPGETRKNNKAFYYGVVTMDQERTIDAAIIMKGESSINISVLVIRECNSQSLGETWSAMGSVAVTGNIQTALYQVTLLSFSFSVNGRGTAVNPAIYLPG